MILTNLTTKKKLVNIICISDTILEYLKNIASTHSPVVSIFAWIFAMVLGWLYILFKIINSLKIKIDVNNIHININYIYYNTALQIKIIITNIIVIFSQMA